MKSFKKPAVGDVFGKLTVIAYPSSGTLRIRFDYWLCKCACGNPREVEVLGRRLLVGKTASCGCLATEVRVRNLARARTEGQWGKIKQAADLDPTWANNFEIFLAELGPCPYGHTLSRRKLTEPFNKANCFWELRHLVVRRTREARRKRIAQTPPKVFSDRKIAKRLLAAAKQRALTKGLPFSLTVEDLLPLPTHCPVFGMRLSAGNRFQQQTSMSLDRKINALGYVKGNCEVISHLANRLKNNAESWQLKRVAAWMCGESNAHEASVGISEGLLL